MTEYEYVSERFEKESETVDVPDDAVGVTVDYFGDLGVVQYLQPVDSDS